MISEGDYEGLISEISAAREKDIKGETYTKIISLFKEMGWYNAKKITQGVVRSERLPSNLYGYINQQWIEIKYRTEEEHLRKEKWQADPGCATPEQWSLWMQITNEVMLWHKLGLVKYNRETKVTPDIDYEQWMSLPRELNKTWSPILDNLFEHMIEPYAKRISQPEFYTGYLREFLEMLKTNRNKRVEPDKLEELEKQEAEMGLKV